jgi:hypothetical protein
MKASKYIKSLIVYLAIGILTIVLFYTLENIEPMLKNQDIVFYLPFFGATEIVLLFLVVFPLAALIGSLIGTGLAPLMTFLHKKIIGHNMDYGFEEIHQSEKFRRIFQGFFPGLMAINFSALIADNPTLQGLVTTDYTYLAASSPAFTNPLGYIQMMTFLVCIPFTLIISFTLFSALWALLDAGIVYSNRKHVEKKRKEKPIIGESVGGWYNYILKGYAGIGAIIIYFELVGLYFTSIPIVANFFTTFTNVYLFLLYFILLPIFTIPTIIILDIFRNWRVEFTRKQAMKLGISKSVTITLQEVEK